MSRLTLLIFALLFIVVGYVAYLSKLVLQENEISRQQLKDLALKLAEDFKRPVSYPADPRVAAWTQKKLEELEKNLAYAKPPDEEAQRAVSFLLGQARSNLQGSRSAAEPQAEAVARALLYLHAAEALLGRPEAASSADVSRPKETAQTPSGAIPKNYRVHRGETLWGISKKLYRTPWRWHDIWKLNADKLPVYKRMHAGTVLKLPA